jgi:hypothetical protein
MNIIREKEIVIKTKKASDNFCRKVVDLNDGKSIIFRKKEITLIKRFIAFGVEEDEDERIDKHFLILKDDKKYFGIYCYYIWKESGYSGYYESPYVELQPEKLELKQDIKYEDTIKFIDGLWKWD